MRLRNLVVALMVCFGVLVLAAPASAQGFGAYGGYDSESEEGLIGIHGHVPISIGKLPKTTITGQFEVLTNWDIFVMNTALSMRFHPWWKEDATISPYFGAGVILGYDDWTEDVNFGGQAIAGLEFPMGSFSPFAQLEVAFGDVEIVAFIGGIQFNF